MYRILHGRAEIRNFSSSVELGGVYMRKLAPGRVSYRDDFFFVSCLHYDWAISYLVI